MEPNSDLIRPSRNKHRSNALATVRLLNRRQTVTLLEQRLSSERNKLNRETAASLQSFEILREKREQLERDELQLLSLFQGNDKFRKEMLICLEQDKQECQKLYCLQRDVHFMQMEKLENNLGKLTEKLEILQASYQNNSNDDWITKFEQLNDTLNFSGQTMANSDVSSNQCHPVEMAMRYALSLNVAEHRQVDTMESRVNKVTRNVQWQIDLKSTAFKQHGQMFLSILNLATHLSLHPQAKVLMNIGKPQLKGKSKNELRVKKSLDRTSSVEEIRNTNMNMKEKWKMLAAAAIGDGRRMSSLGSSAAISDSASVEIRHEESTQPHTDDSYKQTAINKVALIKLSFINQILYDLTLIKEEIDFQTNPMNYNAPGTMS